MNKYKHSSNNNTAQYSFVYDELAAARMHKPGYRRKMRHTNNKHTRKNTSR